ncbi:glycosyltransferase [Nocardioides sp. AX2bis]|uniref:glycosyltransferase n=1 Tax=Nocardioides sp. AX2bis TaxID=2653157 RepID=UPI0012EF163D|nr:glycosyltransferase [Nocardioides sp. AX2bis]VXC52081.1 putative Glycosyltransferase involved in cell wall biosynthesis [Nocardioides sp. AX2bis]
MRILLAHNHHASLGGAMEVLAHEGLLLEGAGHEVTTFTLPAADDLGLSAIRAGAKAVWNAEAARDVGRLIDDFRPDVLHVHTPFPLLSPAVFRVAAARGVPSVTTVHSYRYSCVAGTCFRAGAPCEDCVGSTFKLAGIRHKCYHDSMAATGALTASLVLHRSLGTLHGSINRFLALTPFSKRLLVRDGIPESHVTVKANTVEDPGTSFRPREDLPYVAFAGRLIDVKGVRTLLDAWRTSSPPGLVLRIAGDGPLRGLVEQRSAEDETIEYVGWLSQEDVTAFMGEATCVVVPSEWYEGQPLVTLRSLSVGTPLVTSDLENIAEDVVPYGAGLAFRTGDAGSLASVLTSVARDPASWRARRSAARAAYEARHTPEATVSQLERIYGEVVAEGAHRSWRRQTS